MRGEKNVFFISFYQRIDGFPKKQYFLVPLTESAGCVLPGSEQCCYRTPELRNKDMALASQVVSGSAAAAARPARRPVLHHTASHLKVPSESLSSKPRVKSPLPSNTYGHSRMSEILQQSGIRYSMGLHVCKLRVYCEYFTVI